MSPVAHWSEADYYRASRRARAAWERTRQPRLKHVLDESTGRSWCGLAKPKPQARYYSLDEVRPIDVCAVCMTLSEGRCRS